MGQCFTCTNSHPTGSQSVPPLGRCTQRHAEFTLATPGAVEREREMKRRVLS